MASKSHTSDRVITRRAIEESDTDFLFNLYSTTRADIAGLPWSDAEKRAFCWHQFRSQHVHYQKYFSRAQFDIVLLDDQPVGRVYLDHTEAEYRVIDIAFLPQYRGRGLGSRVMQEILEQADRDHKPVRLRVQPDHPARKWYERLGFRKIAYEQLSWHMERPADRRGNM